MLHNFLSFGFMSHTGKAFTSKGMQVLELVGKESLDLLIRETGMEVDKNSKQSDQEGEDDQLYEEMGFDRCFYIYEGAEHLEGIPEQKDGKTCALWVMRYMVAAYVWPL